MNYPTQEVSIQAADLKVGQTLSLHGTWYKLAKLFQFEWMNSENKLQISAPLTESVEILKLYNNHI